MGKNVNKSKRHKETNTFKFKTFSERISEVNIDIFHRVEHPYESEYDEESTYFYRDVKKWEMLNLTSDFKSFISAIRIETLVNLPQLVLKKDYVIDTVLKALKEADPSNLEPFLSFIASLAKDLRKEFYLYYPRIFEVLWILLNNKEPEVIEWSFSCLAYLFKFLRKFLIKDIAKVVHFLFPLLLDNKADYITDFTAESFAFVVRKVEDRKTFLQLLIKEAQTTGSEAAKGCGKLLFEVIKGVNNEFHSCSKDFLTFFFESLRDDAFNKEIVFEILQYTFQYIVDYISPKNSLQFWDVIKAQFDLILNKIRDSENEPFEHLDRFLLLLGQVVEFKHGKFVLNSKSTTGKINEVLQMGNIPENTFMILVKLVILFLLSDNMKLQQEDVSLLIRSTMKTEYKKVLFYFVENVTPLPSFDAIILPHFLKSSELADFQIDYLKVLASILVKKMPFCKDGTKLTKWKKIPISKDISSKLEQKCSEILLENDEIVYYFSVLSIISRFDISDKDAFYEVLQKSFVKYIENIKNVSSDETDQFWFLLNFTIECLIHLDHLTVLNDYFDLILNKLSEYASHINFLNTVSLILQKKHELITIENFKRLDLHLQNNFCSSVHEIRLLTSFIYSLFESIPEFDIKYSDDPETVPEKFNVFSLCYKIENIEPNVETYREQIRYLEKFKYYMPQSLMCYKTEFKNAMVKYLCGALYMNFQLLWDPIIKVIETHANNSNTDEFWQVFRNELVKINDSKNWKNLIIESRDFNSDFVVLNETYTKFRKISDNADFGNYRYLLWKAMELFPDVAERRSRDFSGLVLNFYENEIKKTVNDFSIDIKQRDNEEKQEINEENLDAFDEETIDGNNETSNEIDLNKTFKNEKEITRWNKKNIKMFLQYLKVFSKFKSPMSIYREQDLRNLYLDLLGNRHKDLQDGALNCLLTYKKQHLINYKDNLRNLVDDKNFTNELATWNIGTESNTIQENHRSDLMPVVLRLVYGKFMNTWGGKGKSKTRTLIIRFLASCQLSEKINFMHLLFSQLNKYLKDDVKTQTRDILDSISLKNFVSFYLLQNSIKILSVILDEFGDIYQSLDEDMLTLILKYAFILGAFIKGAYIKKDKVHSGYLKVIRNLRTSCLQIVNKFFDRFDQYKWTPDEIDVVFELFVWPYLDKLDIEGIHSGSNLLNLIIIWGSNPRYFPLMVKYNPENNLTVLSKVMDLMLNEKSHSTVVDKILLMIKNLLTLIEDHDVSLNISPKNILPVSDETLKSFNESLNFGSSILLPHISSILKVLQIKLERKIRGRHLQPKDIFILSRISELVKGPEISDETLKLLIPVLLRKYYKQNKPDEDLTNQYLTSIKNLMQNVEEPHIHVKELSPLFAEISHVTSRKLLVSILEIIADKTTDSSIYEQLRLAKNVVCELNAWDAKWVNQPDFEKRQIGFKNVCKLIEEEQSIDVTSGILLVYNSCFMLQNEKEISLKNNSSYLLKLICPYILKKYIKSQYNEYLCETILAIIRKGIKSKEKDLRYEFISLLGHIVRECPENNSIFRDLHIFTNKNDLEVDFFENMAHIQLHRHVKALIKFGNIVKVQERLLNPRTLTQFILPLASYYFGNMDYHNKNSLLDAATDCVGICCRILPWHQYEGVLKFYLSKLSSKSMLMFQKQMVKIVVAILDAFHFNLDNADLLQKLKAESQFKTEEKLETKDSKEIEDETELSLIKDDLDEFINDDGNNETFDEIAQNGTIKILDKIILLTKTAANRVLNSLQYKMLPQLHRAMAQVKPTFKGDKQTLKKKYNPEMSDNEELLRIPISLAVVRLLQRLPKTTLDSNLPGIFLKTLQFLQSKWESVRRTARETLQKMIITLGPDYLELLLSQMSSMLQRGFQVHVLVYTTQSILDCLKETYKNGDVDKILLTVLKLCKMDLFGMQSEEKEVEKIKVRCPEAKSSKSFNTLIIMGQFISEKSLLDLVLPFKDVLEQSTNFKVVNRCQECLRNIATGLVENQYIKTETLLKFAYGAASEKIPQLLPTKKKELSEKERHLLQRQKLDCFIIPKAPSDRYGNIKVQVSNQTNAHVMVEFGLRLCLVLLKKDRCKDGDFRSFLDPFVVLLKDCLRSKHVKLSTTTLTCIGLLTKYDLPSMKEHVKEIISSMFEILHKYATPGLSKGDNFDLVVASFKAIGILIRDINYQVINEDQLKILLVYIEQDVYDFNRQAIAFTLLKVILKRKLIVAEIYEIMSKVAELCITSELDHVRFQARTACHQFIMDYPMGKDRIEHYIQFFLSQACFELQYGRESALEVLNSLINSFPEVVLKEHSAVIFIRLGARLVNEEVPSLRKKIARCLNSLITRLSNIAKEPLYEMALLWLDDNQLTHRQMAAQLLGIFVIVEKVHFEKRLKLLIPLLLKQFGLDDGPGKFVRLNNNEDSENSSISDHHLFQVLQLLLKICTHCPIFLKKKDVINDLAVHCQILLSHSHDWVRLAACQFLGFVLSSINVTKLADSLLNDLSNNHEIVDNEHLDDVDTNDIQKLDEILNDDTENKQEVPNDLNISNGNQVNKDSTDEKIDDDEKSEELDDVFTKSDDTREENKPENKISITIVQNSSGYLFENPTESIKRLTLDLCDQLQPGILKQNMTEQVIKNLVFVARVLKQIPIDLSKGKGTLNLLWLCKKLRNVVNRELTEDPTSTMLRTEVFKWIAGVITVLEEEYLSPILIHLMSPLVREITTTERSNAPLRQMAKEIANMVKTKFGMETFSDIFAKTERLLMVRRAERKRNRTQLAVTDPELFAKKKIRRHEKKKELKKRKIEEYKGKRKFKKRKVSETFET